MRLIHCFQYTKSEIWSHFHGIEFKMGINYLQRLYSSTPYCVATTWTQKLCFVWNSFKTVEYKSKYAILNGWYFGISKFVPCANIFTASRSFQVKFQGVEALLFFCCGEMMMMVGMQCNRKKKIFLFHASSIASSLSTSFLPLSLSRRRTTQQATLIMVSVA